MRARLLDALRAAQGLGFVGPGSVEDQLVHGEAFAVLAGDPEGPFLDLGSGAGLPGLAVAIAHPDAPGVLLDASVRRTEWLRDTVEDLGLTPRIQVVQARAEEAAHLPEHHHRYHLVTARSFGSPAVTAECAVAFLHPTGRLVVSDPPDSPTLDSPGARWPEAPLAELGLAVVESRRAGPTHVTVLRPTTPNPRYPRRTGIPTKRPLW